MLSKVIFERLYNASAVFVLTGSGISKASGLPTFRGEDGLWKNNTPESLADLEMFAKNPVLVWDWYRWRQDIIKKAKPNLAHYSLVDLESRFEEFTIVTHNIDGLHQQAGSRNVVEAHGNIFKAKCTKCDHKEIDYLPDSSNPKCVKCGSLMRPDAFMKGDDLDKIALGEAQQSAAVCEVFFAVGTSGTSQPASALPFISKANGSYLVEINTSKTSLSEKFNERVEGRASDWLPKITIVYDQIAGKRK